AEIAEHAASLIQVQYAELPAVFDALDAMADAAPVLHPERTSYQGAPELPPIVNLQGYNVLGKGDIAQGFAAADLVLEHTFSTPASHQGYIEPRACVADVPAAGRM